MMSLERQKVIPLHLQGMNVVEGADASFARRKLQLRTKLETVVAECESKIKTLQLYDSKMKVIDSGKYFAFHSLLSNDTSWKLLFDCGLTCNFVINEKINHLYLCFNLVISDLDTLEQWITGSCDLLTGNMGENASLLQSVKQLDSELSVQKTHLTVRHQLISCSLN